MAKKPLVLGPILVPLTQTWAPKFFSWILPHLDIRNCCKLSLYTIFFKKTNEPNLRKWQKTSLGLFFFSFKNLAPSVTGYSWSAIMHNIRQN